MEEQYIHSMTLAPWILSFFQYIDVAVTSSAEYTKSARKLPAVNTANFLRDNRDLECSESDWWPSYNRLSAEPAERSSGTGE